MVFLPKNFLAAVHSYKHYRYFTSLFQKASCSSGEQNKGVSYIGVRPFYLTILGF